MKAYRTPARIAWSALATLVVAVFVQCNPGTVDLTGRACPCVDGYTCDTTTNTCVPSSSVVAGPDGTVGDESAGDDAGQDSPTTCVGPTCACHTDVDCTNPQLPRCTPDGQCVACLTTSDNCPVMQYCVAGNVCAAGCKTNAECATVQSDAGAQNKLCDTKRRECVECTSPSDCPANMLCSPSGACVVGCDLDAGKGCPAGKSCCNQLCIDTQSDPLNCNGCGTACGGTSPACCSGSCVDKASSTTSCGACGAACSTVQGTPSCSLGVCAWTCNSGFAHCGTGNTGCETSTTNDAAHCGSCTTNCNTTVVFASGISCASSTCNYASCSGGYGDCDGNRANGCEANLSNDVAHCNACGTSCTALVQNAGGVACSASACTYATCNTGYGDCDTNRANGCETNLTNTVTACGSCATNCNTNVLHVSAATCSASKCGYTACLSGYGDCNVNPTDGCECACGRGPGICCPPGNTCLPGWLCESDGLCH